MQQLEIINDAIRSQVQTKEHTCSKKKLVGLYGTLPVDAADVKNVHVFNPGD